MKHKIYVGVTAYVNPEGKAKPVSVTWEDGSVYEIDRITAVKTLGIRIRYTVWIWGRERQLFLEDTGRWYVEREDGIPDPLYEHAND